MSDLFRAVQGALRAHKERGVDLNNPMGVEVFGKLYPATKKGIMVIEGRAGFNKYIPAAYYTIPMENGLMVEGRSSRCSIRNEGQANRLVHQLFQPNINLSERDSEYRYGWTLAKSNENERTDDNLHHINFDEDGLTTENQLGFHETMKKWSKAPSHGLNHTHGDFVSVMSSEDHREHQQNVKTYHLVKHPGKIVITHARSHFAKTHHPISVYYQYDINTEALTPHDWDNHRSGS